jgi:hypothetical protein
LCLRTFPIVMHILWISFLVVLSCPKLSQEFATSGR